MIYSPLFDNNFLLDGNRNVNCCGVFPVVNTITLEPIICELGAPGDACPTKSVDDNLHAWVKSLLFAPLVFERAELLVTTGMLTLGEKRVLEGKDSISRW